MRRLICCMIMLSAVAVSAYGRVPSDADGAAVEWRRASQGGDGREKNGPRMTFERTSHDFGDVARHGGDLIKEFRFVNDGNAPLVIKKITKSCSCLTVTYSRKPVLPGEAAVIKIKYEPHKIEAGIFHLVIQIYTNVSDDGRLITIQGNSIADKASRQRRQ